MNHGNKYVALARREFWEHRSLWMWPVGLTLLLLVAFTCVSLFSAGRLEVHGDWGHGTVETLGASAMDIGVFGLALQILGITALVCFIYLVDCLYAERKDRSILFWKSLPVSDAATVLTKLGVALIVVPLMGFLLVTAAYPIIYSMGAIGVPEFTSVTGGWNTLGWLRAEGSLLLAIFVTMIWYAPLAAWTMLASVIARRVPLVIAVAPILVAGIGESMILHTNYAWRFMGARLRPIADAAQGVQRLDLWLGLVVAAALVFVVIRLRRYRDDT